MSSHATNTVDAIKLEYDHPPTSKAKEEGKPSQIVLCPYSSFVGVYCAPRTKYYIPYTLPHTLYIYIHTYTYHVLGSLSVGALEKKLPCASQAWIHCKPFSVLSFLLGHEAWAEAKCGTYASLADFFKPKGAHMYICIYYIHIFLLGFGP